MRIRRTTRWFGDDWPSRMVRVWEEDDARTPDRERIEAAWKRMRGRDLRNADRTGSYDGGDLSAHLHWDGWIEGYSCEGEFIAVVAEVYE